MIDNKIAEFPITYTNPVSRAAIGWGAHETVANECKALGIKKALIISTGLRGTGIIDEINRILTSNGIETIIYDKVTSNPKDYEVEEGAQVYKSTGCDGIVSVGGGSSHDSGKAIRAMMANEGTYICDMAAFLDPPWMLEIMKYNPPTIPQISVNTTAGTGAENSPASVIINSKLRIKSLIILPGLAPNIAIFDPALARLMPQDLAAWTGFDALTHAFESYVSRGSSCFSSIVMLGAIKMVAENIREFSNNRMNHTACENMCWASSIAGAGLGLGGGVGMVHGIAHGLSVLYGVQHGLANAVVTLPVERYNQSSRPERFADMAKAMGADISGLSKMQASDRWFDEIERLLSDLNIKTGHLNEQFGFKKDEAKHIIKNQYENDFAREGNPRDFVLDDCVKLLEEMF